MTRNDRNPFLTHEQLNNQDVMRKKIIEIERIVANKLTREQQVEEALRSSMEAEAARRREEAQLVDQRIADMKRASLRRQQEIDLALQSITVPAVDTFDDLLEGLDFNLPFPMVQEVTTLSVWTEIFTLIDATEHMTMCSLRRVRRTCIRRLRDEMAAFPSPDEEPALLALIQGQERNLVTEIVQ